MTLEHKSGLPMAFDGVQGRQDMQSVVFYGSRPYIQGRELNDMQEIARGRQERVSRLIAQDGDRVEGAAAVVDIDAGTVFLTAGKIYVAGDVFPVGAAQLIDVPMSGRVAIGVRLVTDFITADDDPTLRGLVPGSKAEGDGNAAAREVATIAWARADDGGAGDFLQVYLLQDGTILDQTPPPALDGMMQALQLYDRPHGHYIVSGCRVSTLGVNAGARIFSIEEGEANISGRKVVRHASLRHAEAEVWDVGAVPGETHTYPGGASHTVQLAFFPLDAVASILLTKEKTVTLTRGALANGQDGLPEPSVISIVSVEQGATVFIAPADFKLTGNSVDWGAAGAEPAIGSSYNVTFRYRASVVADSQTAISVTVSDGAEGGDIIIAYTFKLPRTDILGLLPSGAPAYIKGVSARTNPVRPTAPADVLPLAEIRNDWLGEPVIVSDRVVTGVRMPTWSEIWRYLNVLEDHSRLIQLNRLEQEVDQRDPDAKRGMFVDPFNDDLFRDQGIVQSGALGNGILQLAVVPTFHDTALTTPVTLDWVEEVIVEQGLITGCVLINPYGNFTPLPGTLSLTPAVDFWTVPVTTWASEVTREFQRGVVGWGAPLRTVTSSVDRVGGWDEALPFLRQREVEFEISGFFVGEELQSLTFDGVDITPAGIGPADADGRITGSFMIPENIPAGSKTVVAQGSVTPAEALFTGQGTLAVDVMQRTTTITTARRQARARKSDPQAQIFVPAETRQLLGVDFHLCGIGDRAKNILVHQVTVETGLPTDNLVAEALVPMADAEIGWKAARYGLPVTTPDDRDHAFVVKTDDNAHAISLAALGAFDATLQQAVTAHPYPIGPRLDSVNATTWTPHQKEALSFRLVAARYPVTHKVVDLGTVDLVDESDIQVRALADLPSSTCSVVFEIERTNGAIYKLLPYQVLQLTENLTETVQVRAILTGTPTLSPILYAPVQVITGRVEEEAVYVTRGFSIADADRVSAYLKLALPAGSSASMRRQIDGVWDDLELGATELSPDPAWVERNYRANSISGSTMRIEIKLTGGPAARPRAADFGLGVM